MQTFELAGTARSTCLALSCKHIWSLFRAKYHPGKILLWTFTSRHYLLTCSKFMDTIIEQSRTVKLFLGNLIEDWMGLNYRISYCTLHVFVTNCTRYDSWDPRFLPFCVNIDSFGLKLETTEERMIERYMDWWNARRVMHSPKCFEDLNNDVVYSNSSWSQRGTICPKYNLLPFPHNMDEEWYKEANEIIKFDAITNPEVEWYEWWNERTAVFKNKFKGPSCLP